MFLCPSASVQTSETLISDAPIYIKLRELALIESDVKKDV
jgi:hypothetical protein